ncbi:hypothetical protein QC762_705620 [Podospora pseudocomata]|uniref:Uncharacterized protein n=1 Tax=Podospora pseudocomata TaxID=2093779 RepID=A0ABR0G3D7_9PEZI|nr:hypothetical protein QC762_705620 [Podospora pseudocomata]
MPTFLYHMRNTSPHALAILAHWTRTYRECPTSYPFPKAQPKQALFTSRDQCHPELHRSGTTPKMRGISPSCPDSRSLAALLPQIYNSALDNRLTQQFVSIPSGLIEPHRPKLTIHRHLHIQLHLRHQPRTIVRLLLPLTLPLIGHNRPNLSSISLIPPTRRDHVSIISTQALKAKELCRSRVGYAICRG